MTACSNDEVSKLSLDAVIGFAGSIVNGLHAHPDNKHLIFALGNTVVIRNIASRDQTFLRGHGSRIGCIALSSSGRLIASGEKGEMGFPADIFIWDFESMKSIKRLRLHKVAVQALSFSFNESYLASLGGQDDNTIVIWDVKGDAVPLCGVKAANETSKSVKWYSKSDTNLVTCGNYHLRMWEFDTVNKKLKHLDANLGKNRRMCTSLEIEPTDTHAYVGTKTGDILEIALSRGLFKAALPAGSKPFSMGVTCLTMIPGTSDILVGAGDGTLARISNCKIVKECKISGAPTTIAVTPDRQHFYAGTQECNIYCVDIASFKAEIRTTCHHGRINHVVFPHKYAEVFASCSMNDIRIWNSKTRQELLRINVPNVECHAMSFMLDGKSIVSGWSDGKIRSFLPQSGKLMFAINDAHKNGCTCVKGTGDGTRIVSGGMEGDLRVWKIGRQTQTMVVSLKEHRGRIWDLRLTSDDEKAVTASADGSCVVWNLNTYMRTQCVFDSTIFKSVAWASEEAQLLTTGSDRRITYWDAFDGQSIRIMDGSPDAEINSLDICENGSYFLSGAEDCKVRLWNYNEGLVKYVGSGHSGGITSVAFAPTNQYAVSAGKEGGIFIWKIPQNVYEEANAPI
eukprot:GHVL01001642.1.p1 GENE.GHVL01001642.1~~GHVL01001642.1.p1  ORF type:complete len:625 (+),score=94.32 GHVL01001642.1:101-1975(+)